MVNVYISADYMKIIMHVRLSYPNGIELQSTAKEKKTKNKNQNKTKSFMKIHLKTQRSQSRFVKCGHFVDVYSLYLSITAICKL